MECDASIIVVSVGKMGEGEMLHKTGEMLDLKGGFDGRFYMKEGILLCIRWGTM